MKPETSCLDVNGHLFVPLDEIRYTFSRAGGPGGQHVNKVNTRVTLWFDLEGSPSLTDAQKEKVRRRLKSRISKSGMLRVDGSRFRTQKANLDDVLRRFGLLLAGALQERPRRRKTRMPGAARERRLRAKKRRGMLKQHRSATRRGDYR